MNYIDNLKLGLLNRTDRIEYNFVSNVSKKSSSVNHEILFPKSLIEFYNEVYKFSIDRPRSFHILSISEMKILDGRYLHFSLINNEKIYFDTLNYNSASEWDIINVKTNFLITKTLSSYLTNKIWAWVDRGREIWKSEFLEDSNY